ncbi:ribonuclease P protein component [Putridiphycobacter roseus]|uniref:Ribonuclease P protein component n=1 Tax=Putridiphycobacter roseus TaxID=2219161 RepID=A0A2W1MWU1_9FLAO|nr:ribonuclease P protein component [Putridiphycobacter roseus]PZE16347.1 ribonuclease P protein component [Putridiphycobacter roseus]
MKTEGLKHTFSKAEKLCSKTLISAIYQKGNKLKEYPFILNYMEVPEGYDVASPVQIVVTVPKRRFKLAVKRNRLRRQIKEAYRLNKAPFINAVKTGDKKVALFLVYIGKEKESHLLMEKKIKVLLKRLEEKLAL